MSVAVPNVSSFEADRGEHSEAASTRDHHNRTMSNEDHLLEEEGDDVFSNPDTAELESSRSDATGATSPAPNSPGPNSPINRGNGHIAIASSPQADPFGTLKQSEYTNSGQLKQGINSLTLADLPSTNLTPFQQQSTHDSIAETPKATTMTSSPILSSMRPQYTRTLSASNTTIPSSVLPSGDTSRMTTPRLGGHATSHSTSYLNLSFPQGQQPLLPSAHDMPSDPREAYTLSKLFAHPPSQSPSDEISGFSLGGTNTDNVNMTRSGTGLATPLASSSPIAISRLRSRPTTRPSSPDRLSSPPRGLNAGLGLGSVSRGQIEVEASEPSIFERDIEHRDAGHVLSKQEAIDVAIPSVLDDAVEAITCDDSDQVEVVSPHAPTPVLALSAQALSAHSQSHARLQSAEISLASSPALSPSPPLSSSGGVEAPPGTMAAQIAERLATKSASSPVEEVISNAASPAVQNLSSSRHRRPNSDVSASSNSSMRSRSPQIPLSIGVQQVLDASNNSTASAIRSISPNVAISPSKSTSLTTTPRSGSTSHANLTSLIPRTTASSPTQTTMLPTATALPSLPLPNPFRSHSPTNTSQALLPDGGMPMMSSVSMDGAVMTSSESATMGASLDGLADVITSSQAGSRRVSGSAMSSPVTKIKGLGLEDDVGPYSTRSPAVNSSNTSPNMIGDRSMPGGFVFEGDEDNNASIRNAKSSGSSAVPKHRLSFFSYADIINKTPAEVLDFDSALRQADESLYTSTSMSHSFSSAKALPPADK